ncbi:MAG: hypothetical protein IH819_03725 [Bacteroidetes bacterium]|nr:hypothetical protein [Bacteroidota bacterium]
MRSKILLFFLFTIFLLPEQFLISQQVKFAVIGDYGDGSADEENVASLIDGWGVDFIITTGDNYYGATDGNYSGSWNAIENDIEQFYSDWIDNYQDKQFTNLINKNDLWKYAVEEDAGNDWETILYDDALWLTGNGIFGFEDNLTITTSLGPSIASFFGVHIL